MQQLSYHRDNLSEIVFLILITHCYWQENLFVWDIMTCNVDMLSNLDYLN